jgi:hypothetical protein
MKKLIKKNQAGNKISNNFTDTGTRLLHAVSSFGGSAIGDAIEGLSPRAADVVEKYSLGMIPHTSQEQLEANRSSNPSKWMNRAGQTAGAITNVGVGELAGPVIKATGKAASNQVRTALQKGINPFSYELEGIKNIPENIRRVNRGEPKLFTPEMQDIMSKNSDMRNRIGTAMDSREDAWGTYLGKQQGGKSMIPTGIDPTTGLNRYQLVAKKLIPHDATMLARDLGKDVTSIVNNESIGSRFDSQFGIMGGYERKLSPDKKSLMYRDIWDLHPFNPKSPSATANKFTKPLQNFEVSSVIPGAKPFVSEGILGDIKTKYPSTYYRSMRAVKERIMEIDPAWKTIDYSNPESILKLRKQINDNAVEELKEMKGRGESLSGYISKGDPRPYVDVSPYFNIGKN